MRIVPRQPPALSGSERARGMLWVMQHKYSHTHTRCVPFLHPPHATAALSPRNSQKQNVIHGESRASSAGG